MPKGLILGESKIFYNSNLIEHNGKMFYRAINPTYSLFRAASWAFMCSLITIGEHFEDADPVIVYPSEIIEYIGDSGLLVPLNKITIVPVNTNSDLEKLLKINADIKKKLDLPNDLDASGFENGIRVLFKTYEEQFNKLKNRHLFRHTSDN